MNTFFKTLPNYESCIVSNGRSYIFDRSGTCIRENAGLVPAYLDNALRVNIISMVSLNGRTEIAVDLADGNFKKYETADNINTLMAKLMLKKGFSHFLKRNGSLKDEKTSVQYTQLFFVYPKLYNVFDRINELGVKEIA